MMNSNLLEKDIQKFIKSNLNKSVPDMVLKGSPFETVTIQDLAYQVASRQKCKKKLPSWFNTENIYYPKPIHIEQSSSEKTAAYKSALVSGNSMADLTGGLGVDAVYFSNSIKQLSYCEANKELAEIASHNFKQFHLENIRVQASDGIRFLQNQQNKLDWVFIDPSRRSEVKGKVFLLEDCEPNILEHLDLFFEKSAAIMLKTSPLLDLKLALDSLKYVTDIHIVAVRNEVKELLFILKPNAKNKCKVHTVNYTTNRIQRFDFEIDQQSDATYYSSMKYLYEPNAAVMKSGAFNLISERFGIAKLHKHTHLYTSNELLEFPGRRFEVLEISNYSKKNLKKLLPQGKANITTRNFPETVPTIRKRMGIKQGGDIYLFFTTNIHDKHIVIVCSKV